MADASILAAELFVNDAKASAALSAFPERLRRTQSDIDKIGTGKSNFGKGVTDNLTEVEKRAQKTKSILADTFSPENIVKGAAFGAVISFLAASTRASFDAERANRLLASSATEAGKAYSFLAESNRQFARDAGLSVTNAAAITARIQQLANAAGRPQDLQRLQRGFLELGAARGIGTAELENLIGTILSGQDEGLNRLGLPDPSKLQAAYAAQIGKTVDQLTQMEKTQAAVNAVMEKAGIFTGANADKMASLSGQAERARAQFDNLTTQFGQNITQTLEFRDAVNFLSDALGNLSLSAASVREKLSQGMTPQQIAREASETTGQQARDFFKNLTGLGFAGSLPGVGLLISDILTEGVDVAGQRLEGLIGGAQNRTFDALLKTVEAQSRAEQKQNLSAVEQKIAADTKALDQLLKQGLEAGQKDLTHRISRIIQTNGSLAELRALQGQLNQTILGDKFTQQNDKISDYIEKQIEKGIDKVKELEKASTEALEGIVTRYGAASENPFVKVFSDAEKSAASLEEKIKGLAPETQNAFRDLNQRLSDLDLFKARLENALGVSELRADAANFRTPFDADAQARAQNEFIERFISNNPNYLFLNNLKEITPDARAEILKRFAPSSLTETSADRLQRRLDEQISIIESFRERDDAQLAAIADRRLIAISSSLDPLQLSARQREEFAAAREREADRRERAESDAREIENKKLAALDVIKSDLAGLRKVAETEGLTGVIRIIDQSNGAAETEIKKPNYEDTARSYRQSLASGNRLSNF